MPCLNDCVHLNRDLAKELLIKALKLKNAIKILIIGKPLEYIRNIVEKNKIHAQIKCVNSVEIGNFSADYDFLIFNSLEHLKVMDSLNFNQVIACSFNAHNLEYYQDLIQFRFVRFVDYNFVLFSNSSEIVDWEFI
jgi:hypothetical protein